MIVEEVLRQRLEGIKNEKGSTSPRFPQAGVRAGRAQLPQGRQVRLYHRAGRQVLRQADVPRLYLCQEDAGKLRGNVFSPMGCRSFLSPWKDENGNYKFEGRFNQAWSP